ncbi:MAG TPA: response regulator [Thermoanaerobaculia bacterium]
MDTAGDGAAHPRVLLIEGNGPLRRFFETILGEAAYEVTTAEDGNAGLTHAGASAFDCIVLGSPAPVRSGDVRSTVLEQIERLAPELAARVIVITSHVTGRTLLRRAIRMRVFAVFGKPFNTAVFARTVADCAARRRPASRFHAIPPPVVTRICEEESVPEEW